MKAFSRSLALVAIVFVVVAVPVAAHAASASFYGPIIPAECNCPGTAPSYGCVLATIQNVINFGITLGVVAATIALMYAGFTWMTSGGNPEARSKGRSMLLNVFIGLFILLTAWLVVDFVMKTLYVGDAGSKDFGPWNSILSAKSGDQCIMATKPSNINGVIGNAVTNEVVGSGNQVHPAATPVNGNEAAVRAQFASAGISINHPACADGSGGQGCTNVGGMRQATISQVININNACNGCGAVVTGGSEPGHASGQYSHPSGYKVDLRNTNGALNALLNGLTHTGQRGGDSGGPIFKDACGNEYVNESDHWDITVYQPCALR
ncbi:MAG: peptidoglycan-binding protein [Parcubacteria group bacterium]|nr:peptidoglycan-binding protein [Parcubacteria group bacterium]